MIRTWIDFLFPPLCAICRSRCETRLFCPSCWMLCAPLDPVNRCRHCFQEMEKGGMCKRCRWEPLLPMTRAFVFEANPATSHLCSEIEEQPEAIAGFALYQWVRLEWPIPDAVIPTASAKKIAKAFSSYLEVPYVELRGVEALVEDQTLLLIDVQSSLSHLQEAALVLAEAFPKKMFLLSLISDDFSYF